MLFYENVQHPANPLSSFKECQKCTQKLTLFVEDRFHKIRDLFENFWEENEFNPRQLAYVIVN